MIVENLARTAAGVAHLNYMATLLGGHPGVWPEWELKKKRIRSRGAVDCCHVSEGALSADHVRRILEQASEWDRLPRTVSAYDRESFGSGRDGGEWQVCHDLGTARYAAWDGTSPELAWLRDALEPIVRPSLDVLGIPQSAEWANVCNVNYYGPGDHLSWHVDENDHDAQVSVLVQLSDPDDYEDGELIFGDRDGAWLAVPRTKGTVVVSPAWAVHCVTKVCIGKRKTLLMCMR